jgi:hypothetical protein
MGVEEEVYCAVMYMFVNQTHTTPNSPFAVRTPVALEHPKLYMHGFGSTR